MHDIDLVITVTERHNGERIADFLKDNGVSVVMSVPGRGTAADDMLDFLGLEATEKTVLFSVASGEVKRRLMHGLLYKLRIDMPGAGIALSVPLQSIGGNAALKALLDDKAAAESEGKPMNDMPYTLLVMIANRGCTDQVMDAARAAGAKGGTVLHVKGAGAMHAEKFFGMSIADEKEMIMIVALREQRNDIMKSVMARAGMDTEAHALCFSLPVEQIAGFRLMEELEEL